MVLDFIYPVLGCVHWVEYYRVRWGGDMSEVQARISELRFLRLCLWWFLRYDKEDNGEESWGDLKSMLDAIVSRWEKLEIVLASSDHSKWDFEAPRIWGINKSEFKSEFEAIASQKKETKAREFKLDFVEEKQGWDVPRAKVIKAINNWNLWSMQIESTLKECKLRIRRRSGNLLHCTFKYRLAPSAHQMLEFLDAVLQHLKLIGLEMPKFLDAVLLHLKALLRCLDGEAVPLKKQIETLEEKVRLLQAFFKLIPNCVLELRDFRTGLYDDLNNDINKLVWLSFFFWAKEGDDGIASELNLLLFDMSQKITKPSFSDFTSWYFGVLKVMHPEDALVLGQAVPGILDLLFNCLESPLHYEYHNFRDGMIMYFTFLANPPKEYAEDEELLLILDQLGNVLCQGFPLTPPIDDTENDSSQKEVHPSEFVTMIERLKGKIRLLHNLIPDSSSCNFPRTNGLGFIDFLLHNLKEKLNGDKVFVPFAKSLIIQIKEELLCLRPDLDEIFELQKDHKELQEAWLQLMKLAYLTEHTINSCPVILYPIWYNIVRLADILHEIKVVKGKLDNVMQSNGYNDAVLPKSVGSNGEILTQAWYSGASEGIVGCEEEVATIVDQLIRGPKSLEIVSIVGMGGSGKSTLAKKVYRQVRSQFHKFAFCIVSQVYSTRKLLLQILKDIKPNINDINSKADDDLAHLLHQQLSGQRYLVVIDDIWKIDAWDKVKSSFPNENVGSRIIFTTREHEVAVKAQSKFCPHSKKLLSNKESWELLQKLAFSQAVCPPILSDAAQVIARKCRGLPLAIAVIGRLLARKERSLTLWNDIAEKTSSFAAEEGCMKAVELSYMHLPEHLKSCFLYLGVFDEDLHIPARRLMLLWIAEGFVQKSNRESVEIVAEEYLKELVDRSLLEVTKRSSDNRIKSCRLHDVIGDFCQRKAQEENMFELIDGTASNSSHSNRYRLSIHMNWESFLGVELRDQGIKSLLYNNAYCSGRGYMFSKFQLVEVLDLEKVFLVGENGEVDRVLEIITSLVHLRYLGVSVEHATNMNILSRITNLINLETFILSHSYTRFRLSENFWRMEKLRHLDVDRCNLMPCPTKFDAYRPLYNLECFSTLLSKPEISMRILQRLPNLRKLSCKVDTFMVNKSILVLDFLNKLESLKLDLADLGDVILPMTLKKLSVGGGSVLPSQLGKLPYLEVLKLNGHYMHRWNVEDGEFPMLKLLKLKNSRLREWNLSDGSFPRLEQLVFVKCYYLQNIPASFQESTTLKKIKVLECSSGLENSASEIRDEQNDLGNQIELIILE